MGKSLSILILEDNPADAELIQFELREAGISFTSKVVATEKDFIRELQEFCPDLILSDYDLPQYSGALALAEANTKCPDTPFILVTGAVSEDRAIEILTQGAKDYVLKSRLQQRLVPAVRRALAEAEEHKERKKAEEDLHRASLYSRTLIEASLDPLVTISSEGKVMDVNKATEEITGISRHRLIGTDFSDYFTEPEKARAGYKKAFAEGSVRDYPLAIRHITGRATDVLYNATVYKNEFGEIQGIFAAARDVTELKKAEKDLREAHSTLEERVQIRTAELKAEVTARKKIAETLRDSQSRLSAILDSIADGFYVLDKEWRFVHVNESTLSHMGKTRAEVLGRTLFDVFPDTLNSIIEAEYRCAMESGEPRHFENPSLITGRTLEIHAYPGRDNLTILFRDVTHHKRAENKLRQSEERYRTLFNGMSEGFAIHEIITDGQYTPVDYRFLDINPAFERITGLKREDVVGKTHNELLPDDDPMWARTYGAVALTGEPVHFENYSPALNRYYEVLAYRPAPRQFAVIFMDITERKQAEETMRRSREDMDRAQAVAQIGWWRLDMRNNLLSWSDETHRIFGVQKGTPVNYETFLEIIHPDDRRYVDSQWNAALGGSPYDIEHRIVAHGQVKWVREKAYLEFNDAGQLVGGFGIVQDITARKHAEAEVARLAAFPMLNPNPIIEVDLEGTILFCNPAAERLFPDLRQRGLEHPLLADWEDVRQSVCSGTSKEKTRELTIDDRWYQQTIHFVEEKKRIHIYGHDISLLKEAEKELREHAEQLESTNRDMESFSYSASHDLRAPLRAIAGFAQMILKKEGNRFSEETGRRFRTIIDNVEVMNRLIDDLIAFSRLGSKDVAREIIDMERLVGEVWQEALTINPHREIILEAGKMPAARGDRTLIRQVYSNLLDNAVKFTARRDKAKIEAGSCTRNGEIVYYVRDNGVGFDMKFCDRLFGAFQRIHSEEEYRGTGIGLALVKRIVNRHGGRVWAEGESGKGATFYFTLPAGLCDGHKD